MSDKLLATIELRESVDGRQHHIIKSAGEITCLDVEDYLRRVFVDPLLDGLVAHKESTIPVGALRVSLFCDGRHRACFMARPGADRDAIADAMRRWLDPPPSDLPCVDRLGRET
jgi:hypothetical protein